MQFPEQFEPPGARDATVHTEILSNSALNHLPLDLREWFTPSTVLAWVREEVARIPPEAGVDTAGHAVIPGDRWRTLTTLLAFAYATHTYRSSDIEAACRNDPVFASICPNNGPYVREIEHFRRLHRPGLKHVLSRLVARALQEKRPASGLADPAAEAERRAEEFLVIARHLNAWDE